MNMQSAVTVKTVEFRQTTCKKQRQRHLKAEAADKTSRKKRERRCSKKGKQNQKAHKEPEAAHTGSPNTLLQKLPPKASDRVKSPAQNQKRRPDEKATDEKTVRFRKIPKRKSRKESLHPNKLLKNQLRTKINGTVTSHRNKSAQNGRKLLKRL